MPDEGRKSSPDLSTVASPRATARIRNTAAARIGPCTAEAPDGTPALRSVADAREKAHSRHSSVTFLPVIAVYTAITISRKTQITLTDRQHAFLVSESRRTGLSLAELVRRSIDRTYRPFSQPAVKGFELSLGFWRAPDAAAIGRRTGTR